MSLHFPRSENQGYLFMPFTLCVRTQPAQMSLRAASATQLGGFRSHSQRAVFIAAPPQPQNGKISGKQG